MGYDTIGYDDDPFWTGWTGTAGLRNGSFVRTVEDDLRSIYVIIAFLSPLFGYLHLLTDLGLRLLVECLYD